MKQSFLRHLLVGATLLCMAAILIATFSPAAHAATATSTRTSSCYLYGWVAFTGYDWNPGNSNSTNTCSGNTLKITYQTDGNFVLYCNASSIWSTRTNFSPGSGDSADYTSFQADGNLVVYNYIYYQHHTTLKAVWASNTSGNTGAVITLQRDGNFVIYQYDNGSPSNPLWSSRTNGRC